MSVPPRQEPGGSPGRSRSCGLSSDASATPREMCRLPAFTRLGRHEAVVALDTAWQRESWRPSSLPRRCWAFGTPGEAVTLTPRRSARYSLGLGFPFEEGSPLSPRRECSTPLKGGRGDLPGVFGPKSHKWCLPRGPTAGSKDAASASGASSRRASRTLGFPVASRPLPPPGTTVQVSLRIFAARWRDIYSVRGIAPGAYRDASERALGRRSARSRSHPSRLLRSSSATETSSTWDVSRRPRSLGCSAVVVSRRRALGSRPRWKSWRGAPQGVLPPAG